MTREIISLDDISDVWFDEEFCPICDESVEAGCICKEIYLD